MSQAYGLVIADPYLLREGSELIGSVVSVDINYDITNFRHSISPF
jgi:hypothetical protein